MPVWVRWLSRGWAHQGPRQFVPFEDVVVTVDGERWDEMQALLARPPMPKPRLEEMFRAIDAAEDNEEAEERDAVYHRPPPPNPGLVATTKKSGHGGTPPRPVPDVAGRDLRPAPPFRPNRDLIGYIEEGQHPPLQVPRIDWDTPTGDPMVVARKGFGGGDVGGQGDHYELMRHTGRPECPIAEHQDALRRLGQALLDRDEARKVARHRLDQIAGLERENARLTATVEYYRARLNHPSSGQAA